MRISSEVPEKRVHSRISLIIPVHNGGAAFQVCLTCVRSLSPPPFECVVVVDGLDEFSLNMARGSGARVFTNPNKGGPAAARNLGAFQAEGEILFFVDADVALPSNAVEIVSEVFGRENEIDALIGSYDDAPSEQDFFSQFKNLFHHYTHQSSCEIASTFWGACGAIKTDVFKEAGGFNPVYTLPSIEDIELGYRLKRAGFSIRMVKSLQVKHLKKWSMKRVLMADVFYRAIPWTKLIFTYGKLHNDLNLRISDRIASISAVLFCLGFFASIINPVFLPVTLGSFFLSLFINQRLYKFFYQKRGVFFLLGSVVWHWIYYCYSLAAFSIGFFLYLKERLAEKSFF
jgi:GT2 family glycosyltransferase